MGFTKHVYASCCEDDLMSGSRDGEDGKHGKFSSMTKEQIEKMLQD